MLTTLLQSTGTGATTIVCNLIPSGVVFYAPTIIEPVSQTVTCQLLPSSVTFYPCSIIKRSFVTSYPGPVSTDPSFSPVKRKKRRSKLEIEQLMIKRRKQQDEDEAFFIFLNEVL